jgi:predicted dehydrogenase
VKRIGIVGSGGMGGWHASRWRSLPVELAGFYDADGARAQAAAAQHGGTAFASLEDLLAGCDVVDICTPPADHAATTLAAARAGRHVVCEKPIARTLADGQSMIDACEAAGVRLFIAHVVRFFPEFDRARQVLASGALGELGVVRSVRGGAPPGHSSWFADFAQSGGVILDVAIHDIDYLRWLCGDVRRVFARGLSFRGLPVDHALITLRFASGAIGHVEASWAFPPGSFRTAFELAGSQGLLAHDSDAARPLVVQYQPGAGATGGGGPPAPPSPDDPYRRELEHFLAALESGEPFLVTPRDALEALRVALAAIESVRIGQPVDVAGFGGGI